MMWTNSYYPLTVSSECEISLLSQFVTRITVTTTSQKEISSSVSFIHCNKNPEFPCDSILKSSLTLRFELSPINAPMKSHGDTQVTYIWKLYSCKHRDVTQCHRDATLCLYDCRCHVTWSYVIVNLLWQFSNRSVTSYSNYICSTKITIIKTILCCS